MIIKNRKLNEYYEKSYAPGSKEYKEFKQMNEDMKKASHLISHSKNIIDEFAKNREKMIELAMEMPDLGLRNNLKNIENKIISDANKQFAEAMKIVNKYKKYYVCNLEESVLPTHDKRGNKIEDSKYILATIPEDQSFMYTNLGVLLNYMEVLKENSKDVINDSIETYSNYYNGLETKKDNNKIEKFPWSVPEIEKISKLIIKNKEEAK